MAGIIFGYIALLGLPACFLWRGIVLNLSGSYPMGIVKKAIYYGFFLVILAFHIFVTYWGFFSYLRQLKEVWFYFLAFAPWLPLFNAVPLLLPKEKRRSTALPVSFAVGCLYLVLAWLSCRLFIMWLD